MAEVSPQLTVIAAARPNYVKVAPLVREFTRIGLVTRFVDAGQHASPEMSVQLFEELGLPEPDVRMAIGPGTHANQTARGLIALEADFARTAPLAVVVVGDVNTTLAGALAAAKLNIPVAHVEAGLRSGDRSMPEELNRRLTDHLSRWLFTPSADADENLLREGIAASNIHRVGNVMVDSLQRALPEAKRRAAEVRTRLELPDEFGVVTLHRPSNVDDPEKLGHIVDQLGALARHLPLVFSVHPRTRAMLERVGRGLPHGVRDVPPMGYLDFLSLLHGARLVLTDSGGVQEETTALGVPCITVRETTERPITCTQGTSRLLGADLLELGGLVAAVLDAAPVSAPVIPLWDGRASVRIAEVLATDLRSGELGHLRD